MGTEIAYSGGGYFRFFPLWFVANKMRQADYTMTYFHINDLVPEQMMEKDIFEQYFKEKATLFNRYKRLIKSNLGNKRAFNKMTKLIDEFEFQDLATADKAIKWNHVPIIKL